MVVCCGHSIISPIAEGSKDNYRACLEGHTALKTVATPSGEVCLSMFQQHETDGFTPFERLCISSAVNALKDTEIRSCDPSMVFIFSSTKGNIGELGKMDVSLPRSAQRVLSYFSNPNPPIVVSNACISGVNALLMGMRLIESKRYKTAVVIGADVLSPFIVSGFSSFKAISSEPCRPFDAARKGLNLGEAGAAMVLTEGNSGWVLKTGSMHNDANHISGPSRTGEGAFRCLRDVLSVVPQEEVALVSVHGTATLYNDEMEAKALLRAGLQDKPIMALKGYFGHTLGTAGVLETVMAMQALEHGQMPACRGFETIGTSVALNITNTNRPIAGRTFIKMLSGFGGSNAALAMSLC